MIKLNELYSLYEEANPEIAKKKLEALLSNEDVKLIPMIVSPPIMSNSENLAFYDEHVKPIMKKHGWERVSGELPIFNKKHWNWDEETYPSHDVKALEDLKDAMSFIEPVSDEADEAKNNPNSVASNMLVASKLVDAARDSFDEVFGQGSVNLGVPGVKGKMSMSGAFKRVAAKKGFVPSGDPEWGEKKKTFSN